MFGIQVREDDVYDIYESTLTFYSEEKPEGSSEDRNEIGRHVAGYLVYEKQNGRLALINKHISLQKHVLLLGKYCAA